MRHPLREGRLSSLKEARKELLMQCAPRGVIPVTFHLTQGHCSASQDPYDLLPPTLTSLSSPCTSLSTPATLCSLEVTEGHACAHHGPLPQQHPHVELCFPCRSLTSSSSHLIVAQMPPQEALPDLLSSRILIAWTSLPPFLLFQITFHLPVDYEFT